MSLSALGFLLLFSAGLAMAFIRHPIYGLYTYIAVFYVHPPSRWWGADLPDMRWSLLAGVVTLIATMRLKNTAEQPSWIQTTPARLLLVFTIWMWIQSLWALDPAMHREACILFTKYLVLYYLIYRLIDSPEMLKRFLVAHAAGCLYLGWLAFNVPQGGRLEGVGGPGIDEANAFAMQLATAVPPAAMMILAMPGLYRWLCFAAMPLILNGIVLAGSRSTFLALVCGGLALWYAKPNEYRKLFYVYAVLAVILFGMVASQQFWERIGTLKATVESPEEIDNSALSRVATAKAQLRMFASYPHGAGHRGTAVLSPHYLEERFLTVSSDGTLARSSHNTFMTALVEQGVPGLIIYLWLWFWTMARVMRLRNEGRGRWPPDIVALAAGVGGALLVIFVAGQFVDYLKAEVQFWMLAVLASQAAFGLRAEKADPKAAWARQRPITPVPKHTPRA